MKKVVVSAGGTGGHLFPAIAVGEELLTRGYEVHLVTDPRCQKYLSHDLKLIAHIIGGKISYKNLITKIYALISILITTYKSIWLLRKINPILVIGFGGYPSFPPLFASIILGIPIVIHEQNCFLGKANRFLMPFAKKVALSYQETKNINCAVGKANKFVITGDIIRASVRKLPKKANFDSPVFTIFIFGGSQSAKIFSTLVPKTIRILKGLNPAIKLRIIQQASSSEQDSIAQIYSELEIPCQLADFFYNIAKQYENSDLVISRAGASTVAELAAIGLPAIFIPLPTAAENHQFYNAAALDKAGAGWCYAQSAVTPEILATKILELINNRHLLKQASSNLLIRQNNGSEILADTVEKIIS